VLHLLRTLIWQRHTPPGAEYFGLWRDDSGWQLRGTVIVPLNFLPVRVRYGIVCDAGWRTRAVHVAFRTGTKEQALHLTADGNGNWERAGEALPELQGCLDVDLEVTPATNTLPVRRLALSPGHHANVTAAWVRFPDLTIEPLDQAYRCTGEGRFRYESGTGFTAEIETDDLGLVTRYADLWTCVARQDFGIPA